MPALRSADVWSSQTWFLSTVCADSADDGPECGPGLLTYRQLPGHVHWLFTRAGCVCLRDSETSHDCAGR